MAYLELSGWSCMRGRVTLPRIGPWVADLTLEPTSAVGTPPTVGQPVTLSLNSALSLSGTVRRAQNAYGTVFMRVIGGGGGFPATVPAVGYAGTQVGQVLSDLMGAIGETLSRQADNALLSTSLSAWVRPAGSAAQAMTAIMAELSAAWRVLPDGTTWVGQETWPASNMAFALLSYAPQELRMSFYSDAPVILPGQTMPGGGYVSVVEHVIDGDKIRSSVLFEDPQLMGIAGLGSDRLKLDLENFIAAVQPNFDFYALNPGTVEAPGSGPNQFDFTPDNPNLPGLQSITLRTGIPGCTVNIDPTQSPKCLLGFEGGDPKAPFLALWNGGGLLSAEIDATTSINLNAPIVGLGPSWIPLITALTTVTTPTVNALNGPALTLLTLLQSLQGP